MGTNLSDEVLFEMFILAPVCEEVEGGGRENVREGDGGREGREMCRKIIEY